MEVITITTCNYGGEYAVVVLEGNFTYTFSSSIATDFIEITNTANTAINTGTGSVSINNSGIDTVRMHIFTNSACSTQNTCRTTTVNRSPCLANVQFPTYVDTANSNYDTHFVSNCNNAGQFFEIVLFAGSYEFASSDTSDIFVFTDTANNLFFAQQTPVIANVTTTTFLVVRVHIFSNSLCGEEYSCRTTTVTRLPCIATSQYPNYTVQSSYDPAIDTITNCNYAGEFIEMDVSGGETYVVSSDSSDWFFLTLTDDTYLSSGETPFSFTNPYGDTTLRLHIFRDSNCGEINSCRQTYVRCTTCPVPEPEISSSDSVACLDDLPVTLTNTSPFLGETYWYEGSCASIPIDSGLTIQVSPSTSATYFCANSYEGQLSLCDSQHLEVFVSPTVNIGSVINVLCHGNQSGSAIAAGSSGLPPYSYLWSNGEDSSAIENVGVGSISVLLTDNNGCFAYDTVQITQPEPLEDSVFNLITPLCFEDETGAIGILISGGVTPYSYSWSTGATTATINDLSNGTYSLTLTDNNNCEEVYSYDIIAPDSLVNDISVTDVWCEGDSNGSVNTAVNGGTSPYEFNWSNAATTSDLTAIAAGVYLVTVIDSNGCEIIDSAIVEYSHAAPQINMDSSDIICVDQTLTLDAGAGFIYSWSTGQSTQTITIASAGTYTVSVTDFNGCSSSQSIIVLADSCLGITTIMNNSAFQLYPNPTNGLVQFELNLRSVKLINVTLVNLMGQTVRTISLENARSGYFDFSGLAKGVYMFNAHFEDGIRSEQLIIQ
jgi:hypothetical protein